MNGARLPAPSFCPHDVAQIMNSCWQQDPHARPSFSQITKLLHQTHFIQDALQYRNRNGQYLTVGENTGYTNVLNNSSMYAQYRTIQKTNLSYMKMEANSFNIEHNNDETDVINNDESEALEKYDSHSDYCHYTVLRSPKRSVSSDESDSGAFSDNFRLSTTNTVETEVGNENNLERWQIGRLQSLNEVEEDLKLETC